MIKKLTTITETEMDKLLEIWLQANSEAHSFIPNSYWQEHLAIVKEELPQADLYVYLKKEQILGFLGLVDTFVAGIFVQKEQRNQGIGQQLLMQAKQNCSHLTLTVYAKNEQAVHFYFSQGFKKIAEQLDQTGEIEYVLQWSR
jgi:putative acetyltransferase